ncbi:hypothetical protein KHA93_19720 [Bacillus sp. FJAT-49732]|uniref:Uncharacterized protein n=1 Tax=Lederbergia citrisecunda TaxID=2833583 RepID=A0A942TRZ5_9BACI|nr:hypothetical protein [Lederbergia citrisecunda]MBS4201837.1 hypothetical protein [Lederbergia citrisecunda]
MKTFSHLFIVNIRQAIFSVRFLLSALGVAVAILFSIGGLVAEAHDVLYLLIMGFGGGNVVLIIGILPLFPFATTFASEWEQRSTSFWIIRTGVGYYSVSKVFVSALSGFLTTAVGVILFVVAMQTKLPLFSYNSSGDGYSVLLDANKPLEYLTYFVTHISLTSALFAVIALWVSTYFPNKSVTIAAPLVVYFVINRLTTDLDIPRYFKAMGIVEEIISIGSPLASLLLKLGIVSILCLLMGYGTVRQIRGRVRHE